jgi:hypothetical protein
LVERVVKVDTDKSPKMCVDQVRNGMDNFLEKNVGRARAGFKSIPEEHEHTPNILRTDRQL